MLRVPSSNWLRIALGMLWLAVSVSALAQAPAGANGLPPGLQVVQLDGSLVCPPCLVPGIGILVACDDRTVSLIAPSGLRVWRKELDRSIHGPLTALAVGMVLVPLSGGQLACLGLDGRLFWQRRIANDGQFDLFGTPEGRIIKVERSGLISFLNPNANFLLSLKASKDLMAAPHAVPAGLELPLADGTVCLLSWNGSIGQARPAQAPIPEPNSLHFRAENQANGNYRVRLSSAEAFLDFSAPGKIGHWLVDNIHGITVAWGDSLWRCFIFSKVTLPTVMPENKLETVPDLADSLLLETRYLQTLVTEDPLSGYSEAIRHIERVIDSGKLAGRLGLYEGTLLGIATSQHARHYLASPDQRVKAIATLARFPSFTQLKQLSDQLRIEDDPAVIAAILDFGAQLGNDPAGILHQSILERETVWAASGMLNSLKESIRRLDFKDDFN